MQAGSRLGCALKSGGGQYSPEHRSGSLLVVGTGPTCRLELRAKEHTQIPRLVGDLTRGSVDAG